MVQNGVEKHYFCNVCEQSFTRSTHLQMHINDHSGVNPKFCHAILIRTFKTICTKCEFNLLLNICVALNGANLIIDIYIHSVGRKRKHKKLKLFSS